MRGHHAGHSKLSDLSNPTVVHSGWADRFQANSAGDGRGRGVDVLLLLEPYSRPICKCQCARSVPRTVNAFQGLSHYSQTNDGGLPVVAPSFCSV